MESKARAAAPPESRKRRERARTVRALHRTTKAAPSSHAASADRRGAGGGGGSGAGGGDGDAGTSSFYGLIREDGEHRRRRREASSSSSSSSSFADPSSSPDGLVGAAIVVDGVDLDVRLVAEVRRASLVKSLRRTLQSSCEGAGIVAPIYTWERWQSRCKLHELLHPSSSSSPSPSPSTASDEVLPCTGHVDAGCVADLVRGGCDPAAAAAIATALGLAAAGAAAELAAFTASLSSSPPVPVRDGSAAGSSGRGDGTDDGRDKDDSVRGNGSVEDGAAGGMSNRQRKRIKLRRQKAMRSAAAACGGQKRQRSSLLEEEVARHAVQVRSHRHSVDFSVLSGGKKLFKLNHGHYEKLRLLVAASCGGSVGGDPPGAGGGVVRVSESDFHKLVYCVLSRYHSVLGHGFQMALGEQAFDVLRAWFDVRFECFASPLNCTCGSYASAFPLADRCFGAVGNFFSLRPSVGSFEANPPFIAEVMSAMVDHMHELLRDATGPMSFVVIVPGWLEDPAWMALSASSFKRAFFLVAAADHGFCDGAQHQRQDR